MTVQVYKVLGWGTQRRGDPTVLEGGRVRLGQAFPDNEKGDSELGPEG